MVKGMMAKRALRMVFDWAELHRDELSQDWQLARERKALRPIPPLP